MYEYAEVADVVLAVCVELSRSVESGVAYGVAVVVGESTEGVVCGCDEDTLIGVVVHVCDLVDGESLDCVGMLQQEVSVVCGLVYLVGLEETGVYAPHEDEVCR